MTKSSAPPTNTVLERRQQEQIADALADGAKQTWPLPLRKGEEG